MKWVGIPFLVACGSSTKPAAAPPPPPPAPAPVAPAPPSFDCGALIAHVEQLIGAPFAAGDRERVVADCKLRLAKDPHETYMVCLLRSEAPAELIGCQKLSKPGVADKLAKDCAEMNDHVMAFFEDDKLELTPEQRQDAIDNCVTTYAGQPDHPSLPCAMHAESVNAALACMKDAPHRHVTKRTQAQINFERISKLAHAAHDRSGAFPKGTAPLLPEVSCCNTKSHKCEPTPTWKTDPVWSALGFAMEEPGLFQYAYASDGTTFHAEAVGDLDCDGIFITWKLDGDASGEKVTPPPPNSD